jgi:hypothetical protein
VISAYEYVTLVAVDDYISDNAISKVINDVNKSPASSLSKSLAVGFGPDLTYLAKEYGTRPRLFVLPKYSHMTRTPMIFQEYWQQMRDALSNEDGSNRLFEFIYNVGFHPFVYAIYRTEGLGMFLNSFENALESARIDTNSSKAGILFEFSIVAISILLSKIRLIESPFRIANYSYNSEGSVASYNYKHQLDDISDLSQNIAYFSSVAKDINDTLGEQIISCSYLATSFSLVGNLARLMEKVINTYAHDQILRSSQYQRLGLRYMVSQLNDNQEIVGIKNFLYSWFN